MKHADFAIGTEFELCTGQRWRCTDVGQRTIMAIELQPELEEAWFCGPPFPVAEVVFDEYDIAGAFRSADEHIIDALAAVDRGLHPGYPSEVVRTMMEAGLPDDARRYPPPELLRVDRVDAAGEILHPYAAERTPEGWSILLYAPFTKAFSALLESEFVQMRPAKPSDFEAREQAVATRVDREA